MRKILLSVFSAAAVLASAQVGVSGLGAEKSVVGMREMAGTWADKAAAAYAGGDGSAESPYQISTAEELAKMAKDVFDGVQTAGVYYELTEDIDLAGAEWFPIGFNNSRAGEQMPFSGIFDGKGHRLSNLKMERNADLSCAGFFGYTTGDAEIRNLTIESGSVTGDMMVGSLVGYNCGLVENCTNRADVSCVLMYSGGIVGANDMFAGELTGIVRKCVNYGRVLAGTGANGMSAGGIAGGNMSVIERCGNFGDVSAVTSVVGGITSLMDAGKVENCFNRGNVSAPEQVGGVVGTVYLRNGACEIRNCYSAAQLESGNGDFGGICSLLMPGGADFFDVSVSSTYYDSNLFSGPGFSYADDYGMGIFTLEEPVAMTTVEMKEVQFVETLNGAEEKKVWVADSKDMNEGYPVLAFMTGEDDESAGGEAVMEGASCRFYGVGGQICAEGVASDGMIRVCTLSGAVVYDGTSERLAGMRFEKGLYIVTFDARSQKVAVR